MLRDVFIASINKGQFPLAIAGGLAALLILKMPPEDVSRLVFRIFEGLKHGWLAGYVISALSLGGWFFHARFQRRIINDEMTRISNERNKSQSKAMGGTKLPSSRGSS
jgi:hypothetical protein